MGQDPESMGKATRLLKKFHKRDRTIVAVVAFSLILFSSTMAFLPFKDQIIQTFYPKSQSLAAPIPINPQYIVVNKTGANPGGVCCTWNEYAPENFISCLGGSGTSCSQYQNAADEVREVVFGTGAKDTKPDTLNSSRRLALAYNIPYFKYTEKEGRGDSKTKIDEIIANLTALAEQKDMPILFKLDGISYLDRRPDLFNWWDPASRSDCNDWGCACTNYTCYTCDGSSLRINGDPADCNFETPRCSLPNMAGGYCRGTDSDSGKVCNIIAGPPFCYRCEGGVLAAADLANCQTSTPACNESLPGVYCKGDSSALNKTCAAVTVPDNSGSGGCSAKENVEWTSWSSSSALQKSWRSWEGEAEVGPQPNLGSPYYIQAKQSELKRLIPQVARWYNGLPEEKKYLLAGIVLDNELSIGINNYTPAGGMPDLNSGPSFGKQQLGFAALKSYGLKSSETIAMGDLDTAVKRHGQMLAETAREAALTVGTDLNDKIYLHGGGNSADYYAGGYAYEDMINPDVRPGWSFYDAAYNPGNAPGFSAALDKLNGGSWGAVEWNPDVSNGKGQAFWESALRNTLNYRNNKLVDIYNWESIINNRAALNAVKNVLADGLPTSTPTVQPTDSPVPTEAPTAAPTTPVASLSVSPFTLNPQDSVNISFANVSNPQPGDFLAIYPQGVADPYLSDYISASNCDKTSSTAKSTGQCTYPLFEGVEAGIYEVRLFRQGSWVKLATSSTFTINSSTSPNPPTLAAVPTTAPTATITPTPTTPVGPFLQASPLNPLPGGSVTVRWGNLVSPGRFDYIALYLNSTPDTGIYNYLNYFYTSTCSKSYGYASPASGSCNFTMPTNANSYNFKIISNYAMKAKSEVVTTGGGVVPTSAPTPTVKLTTTPIVNPTATPTLRPSATPTQAASGTISLTVSPSLAYSNMSVNIAWSGISTPNTWDTISVSDGGSFNMNLYTSTCNDIEPNPYALKASGSCSWTVPAYSGGKTFTIKLLSGRTSSVLGTTTLWIR